MAALPLIDPGALAPAPASPCRPALEHPRRRRTGGVVRAGVQQHHAARRRLAERVAHMLKVEPPGLLVVVWVAAEKVRDH